MSCFSHCKRKDASQSRIRTMSADLNGETFDFAPQKAVVFFVFDKLKFWPSIPYFFRVESVTRVQICP